MEVEEGLEMRRKQRCAEKVSMQEGEKEKELDERVQAFHEMLLDVLEMQLRIK